MTSSHHSFFQRYGWVLLEEFLPVADCERLSSEIAAERAAFMQVAYSSKMTHLHFHTMNGKDIDDRLPGVTALYSRVNEVVNDLAGRHYTPLDNRRIGLSLNVTPPGGQFTWHYDRNEITAVLLVNRVGGGELEIYPRHRILLPQQRGKILEWLQEALDAPLRSRSLQSFFRKEVVTTHPGRLVIMEASRCLHRVRVVESGERHSLLFAYDRPDRTFPPERTTDYYGYAPTA